MQTKLLSMCETGVKAILGFLVYTALNHFWLGFSPEQSVGITAAYACFGLLKSYGVRRCFNLLEVN